MSRGRGQGGACHWHKFTHHQHPAWGLPERPLGAQRTTGRPLPHITTSCKTLPTPHRPRVLCRPGLRVSWETQALPPSRCCPLTHLAPRWPASPKALSPRGWLVPPTLLAILAAVSPQHALGAFQRAPGPGEFPAPSPAQDGCLGRAATLSPRSTRCAAYGAVAD